MFRDARIEERTAAGEFRIEVSKRGDHIAAGHTGEPPGTVSHTVVYLDPDDRVVALAHEYLRPDGSIGGSGRRDPKLVRVAGVTYKQRR